MKNVNRLNKMIAICVPYYNKRKVLFQLIESILRQTYTNYVVIITDDSRDNQVKEYVERLDARYIYVCNEKQLGPTANCNKAIQIAQQYKPVYIKVMHHDDYFAKDNSLELFVAALENNPDAILAFSNNYSEQYVSGEIGERIVSKEQLTVLAEDFYSLIENNIIGAPSGVIVRNCGIYMDENLIWMVDVDWYLKLLESSKKYVHINESLISIGSDGEKVTDYCLQNKSVIQRENIYVYLKHYKLQKDTITDSIIRRCVREYGGMQCAGAYCKEELWAMLQDATRDGKNICVWGTNEEKMETTRKYLKSRGIEVKYFHLEGNESTAAIKGILLTRDALLDMKDSVLCLIIMKNAKDVRKNLNKEGVNALPFYNMYM